MHEHTPGPWRIGQAFKDDEGYREIAVMATVRGHDVCPATVVLQFPNVPGMQEANAFLIAAAPDLLAALEQARMALAGYLPAHSNAVTAAAIERATAVIAKATGEA